MSGNSSGSDEYPCSGVPLHVDLYKGYGAVKAALLLPLYSLVLRRGGALRRQQQRSRRAATLSELCTFHQAGMELLWLVGFVGFLVGDEARTLPLMVLEVCLSSLNLYGEILFLTLTCAEHYLAVVRSVAYRGLRGARGLRVRAAGVALVWALAGVNAVVNGMDLYNQATVPFFCILPAAALAVSFCCLSALRALLRPGPGGGAGARRSKRKAFQAITAILAALWAWLLGLLLVSGLIRSGHLGMDVGCVLDVSICVFNLPCSVVLPLLYLQKSERRWRCCCRPSSE